jgi:hypothetical protein
LLAFSYDGKIEGVNYSQITALLTKGIQQQQGQINSMDARLAVLEAQAGGGSSTPGTMTFSQAIVTGKLQVAGIMELGEDTVGRAKIIAGDTKVDVKFTAPYTYEPIVTLAPINFTGNYKLKDITKQGFTIELEAAELADVTFNWNAFAGKGGKITNSNGTKDELN